MVNYCVKMMINYYNLVILNERNKNPFLIYHVSAIEHQQTLIILLNWWNFDAS